MAFKRDFIIKRRTDFQRIQSTRGVKGRYVVICSQQSEKAQLQVGFTVSKRIGNAVVRNRCKRRLREVAYILLKNKLSVSRAYVFIAKKEILHASWSALISDISSILGRL